MKKRHTAAALAAIAGAVLLGTGYLFLRPADRILHEFERRELSDRFHAEGGAAGDIDGDGTPDVVAGPYWYEGPDFGRRHTYREPLDFDPLDYSDHFIAHVHDFDEDGWEDILVIGFPGEAAFWYMNPQGGEALWDRYVAFPSVDNESAAILDFTGNGRPEMVFLSGGYLGYATYDPAQPTEPWAFHRVSERHAWGRFTHGLGAGDVDGDSLPDLLMAEGWWENPGFGSDARWEHHAVDFGRGGAQMYAYDVDRDGLNDVVTSLDAHGWGLAWFRQTSEGDFERNLIMGEEIEKNPFGVRFSQPHALKIADMDLDGLTDLVTGKRWWAHGESGDPEPNADAVLYWFRLELSEEGEASFIPYLIDDDSGVGVDVTVEDLDEDSYPDILIVNKKGAFVFRQLVHEVKASEWEAAQPTLLSDAD